MKASDLTDQSECAEIDYPPSECGVVNTGMLLVDNTPAAETDHSRYKCTLLLNFISHFNFRLDTRRHDLRQIIKNFCCANRQRALSLYTWDPVYWVPVYTHTSLGLKTVLLK